MTLFLDTETTGLSPSSGADLVEVAIVNDDGDVILNTLVDPGSQIPPEVAAIHGITDSMVSGAPPVAEVRQQVLKLVRGVELVIYNAPFDTAFFPGIEQTAAATRCCMRRFSDEWPCRVWSAEQDGWKRQKLSTAAAHVGHDWQGAGAHRALADALACRTVWRWLEVQNEGVGKREEFDFLPRKSIM